MSAKRDEHGRKYPHPKGITPEQLLINGTLHPYSHRLRHELYLSLWHLYFLENPHLLEEAMLYEQFYDNTCWNGEVFPKDGNYPGDTEERGCNQARAIAYLAWMGQYGLPVAWEQCVVDAMVAYCRRWW